MLALLALTALAQDPTPSSAPLFRPESRPPPGEQAAVTFVADVLDRLDGADEAYLRERFVPGALPAGPGEAWYGQLLASLHPEAALGKALRSSEGPVAIVDGPDYTRVVLEGEPLLSLVVRGTDTGLVVDRVEATTCDDCGEPERFASDTLAAVARGGRHYLMPFVGLSVEQHLADNRSLTWSHWIGSLQIRNEKAGELRQLFQGAVVDKASQDEVVLSYADGRSDNWHLVYEHGRWAIDYSLLPEDSPMRLSDAAMTAWRRPDVVREARLMRWEPTWQKSVDGAGTQVGRRAIGAHFDPRDDTLIVTSFDQDRSLSASFRVDPDHQQVTERWPLPADFTNPLPIDGWFAQWRTALSPDGRTLAVTLPTRLYALDLETGRERLVVRTHEVSNLAWEPRVDAEPALLVCEERGKVLAVDKTWTDGWLSSRPLAAATSAEGLWTVSELGVLAHHGADGRGQPVASGCCGTATTARFAPDRSEVLLQCGPGCDIAATRISTADGHMAHLDGSSGALDGTSWSPDGRFFTTRAVPGAPHAVVLWQADTNRPIATFGLGRVRQVEWSADGQRLLTVDTEGEVWMWELAAVRRKSGL